jgi:hypothetical protein
LFPQIHHFPEFTLKCQAHYLPDQRAIVSSSGETLFTITPEAIDQMLQITRAESFSPFTIEILTEMYQKLSFPQRAQIFELFLPESAPLPKANPPYQSSIFSVKGNQIISSLCSLLGYYSDEWVDEPILGYLSIFSTEESTTMQFDYNSFLAENIHEQLFKFPTEGMFRYSSILAYLFIFFQDRQIHVFHAEARSEWKTTAGHILDVTTEKELTRIHLQSVHRSVLPSSGKYAQRQTRTKDKRRNPMNFTPLRPRQDRRLVPVPEPHRD